MLILGALERIAGIRHGFFTRAGGVSDGIYGSLNCGFGSDDSADNVAVNRERAMARLDLDRHALVTVYQVHGTAVHVVDGTARAAPPCADAMVTGTPGAALGILTADCAPVLLAEPGAGVIGAAHAGWRGALDGVLEATIAAMEALGARRASIHAAIGPCIARDSYQVGPEFPERFTALDAANDRFFGPSDRPGHFVFDLEGYVAARLGAAGIAGIDAAGRDTCAEDEHFFSYRRSTLRGEPDYGRGLSAITLIG